MFSNFFSYCFSVDHKEKIREQEATNKTKNENDKIQKKRLYIIQLIINVIGWKLIRTQNDDRTVT